MILVATLLADGRYTDERYGLALKEFYAREALRFPDGSVSAACEHMFSEKANSCGVKSTTAVCLPRFFPFALAFPDVHEGTRAGSPGLLGHPYPPGAHAAVSTFITLLYYAIHDSPEPCRIKPCSRHRMRTRYLGARSIPQWTLKKMDRNGHGGS